ncbi:MAG TPA: hypothetical protein ENI86_00195 [Acidimicrobiales bacterium]|nr:hypothetical protein [Acidimicrobiales bacterium]
MSDETTPSVAETYRRAGYEIPEHLGSAHDRHWPALGGPGDWLDGETRRRIIIETRNARNCELCRRRSEAVSPNAVPGNHDATTDLDPAMVDAVHRVSVDAKRLSRTFAEAAMAEMGPGPYVEMVGVVACTWLMDVFAWALGVDEPGVPERRPGEPVGEIPEGTGDVGAWVPQELEKVRANVTRALSYAPLTNGSWRGLVNEHYSRGEQFGHLVWDRALSRPQVELVAARTAALNECFY